MAGSYSPVGGGYNIAYAVQVQDLFSKPLDDFAKKMSSVEQQVADTSQKIERKLKFSQIAGGLETFGRKMSLYVSAPLAAFGGVALKYAANIQVLQRSMQAFTGDKALGADLFSRIDKLSNKSIFSINEYADAAKVLMGSGVSNAGNVVDRLKEMGDVAAVFQIPMSAMASQAAFAKTAGLNSRIVTSMLKDGIPVYKELQKYLKNVTGKTFSQRQMEQFVEKGRISGNAYLAIIKQLTEKGNIAYKGMDEGTAGLTQSFALMKNSLHQLTEDVGLALDKTLNISGGLKKASDHVNTFTLSFLDFSEKNPAVIKNLSVLGGILIGLPPLLTAVTWAIRLMTGSLMLNPVILAITALAASIAFLVMNAEKLNNFAVAAGTPSLAEGANSSLSKAISGEGFGSRSLFASERGIMTKSLQNNSNVQVDLNVKDPKGYVESVKSKNDGINKFNLGMNGVAAMPAY